jgi:hypothetical protein
VCARGSNRALLGAPSTSPLAAMLRVSALFGLIVVLALAVDSLSTPAANRPLVFNHISGQRTDIDQAVHEHFDKFYEVVDFTDRDHTYAYPRPSRGFGPTQPVYTSTTAACLGAFWSRT